MYRPIKVIPLRMAARYVATTNDGFVCHDALDNLEVEVYHYHIANDTKNIFFHHKNSVINCIQNLSPEVVAISESIFFYPKIDDLKNAKLSIYDFAKGEVLEAESEEGYSFYSRFFENNKVLYKEAYITGKTVTYNGEKGLYSISEKRVVWKNYKTLMNPHIKQGYLFDYQDTYFARYSTETGELLWKIDVSELGHGLTFTHDEYVGSVYDIICVYKGVVYVAFKSSRSAGIDIETGEVVWDMLDIYIGTRTPDIKGFALDTQRDGILHGLWAGYYVEIDLNQRTRTQHYIRDIVESKNLEIPNTFIQNGKYLFYSSGALAGNDKNTIAAFNPSTKDIDWQYEFDLADAYTISQPLFGGKYMYVYDNNLRLHVFEKEENE